MNDLPLSDAGLETPSEPVTLLRTALYVPGSNQRALDKALSLGADALILDLEDSVAPEAKESARASVLSFLKSTQRERNRPPQVSVRINPLTSPLWRVDVETLLEGEPDALVIPKVDSAAMMEPLLERMPENAPQLWPMIESPQAVLDASTIAGLPHVTTLVMGTSDLFKSMRPFDHSLNQERTDRRMFHVALQHAVLAARARAVRILDGVWVDLADPEGFMSECREGLSLGFDGKTVIHPKQVMPANRVFLPDAGTVRQAQKVLAAWKRSRQSGEEICTLDGVLVERLHAEDAARVIRIHQAGTGQ
ncbi:MAG: CoA ester lyase [Magnetococcales bacterium]|nr:CoA ester lyase [Magnetococcales bacterium]